MMHQVKIRKKIIWCCRSWTCANPKLSSHTKLFPRAFSSTLTCFGGAYISVKDTHCSAMIFCKTALLLRASKTKRGFTSSSGQQAIYFECYWFDWLQSSATDLTAKALANSNFDAGIRVISFEKTSHERAGKPWSGWGRICTDHNILRTDCR